METAEAPAGTAEEIAAFWRREAQRWQFIAMHDPMTGLLNRAALYGTHQEFQERLWYITVLDVNGLKAINDARGHASGDRYITRIAKTIQASAENAEGFAYRIGGDEFVTVTRRAPKFPDHMPTARGESVRFPGESLDDAIQRADRLMYQNKAASRHHRTREGV